MNKPKNHILVIFGASGDLTYRKLVPAVFDLHHQKLLPKHFAILGLGRTQLENKEFRTKMEKGIKEFALHKTDNTEILNDFLDKLFYYSFDTKSADEYKGFKEHLLQLDQSCGTEQNFIYYLATPPSMYEIIPAHLSAQDLGNENHGFKRLIVEKPFGYDLKTAKKLNKSLLHNFEEEQIYRIDHYLGKETVQNLLVITSYSIHYTKLYENLALLATPSSGAA